MALATRCPNCQSLFRVGTEQLRSRGGMVRCGSCRRVFNAIAGLDYLDAQRLAADAAAPAAGPAAGAAARPGTAAAPPGGEKPAHAAAAPANAPAAAAPARAEERRAVPRAPEGAATAATRQPEKKPAAIEREDPRRGQSSWVDLAAFSLAQGDAPAGSPAPEAGDMQGPATLFAIAKPAIEAGAAQDDSSAEDAAAPPEPSFLRPAAGTPTPAARAGLGLAIAMLVVALGAQLALIFRSPIIVALPAVRPALQALCAPFGCTATWPMRPDLLAVVSSELESVPGTDALELDAVLRNRADHALALPAIELTISDDTGHAVVRRVFLPADYRGPGAEGGADPGSGSIGAGADLAVRIRFEFPGGSAAGFEAYPFYP